MLRVDHPEVLTHDWLPPTLIGRGPELERLRTLLGDPIPARPMPWVAGVQGPSGSGTSATARLAARRIVEAFRRERPGATSPLLVAVRVRWCAGSHGVATALLQSLDDGFVGRGFPVVEIVAGFLRRLARIGRPAVVVLDDIGPDTPDLDPILRGLLAPLRFLPEGIDAAPPIWTIVAGQLDRAGAGRTRAALGPAEAARVTLGPLDLATLGGILRDRASRALGRPAPEPWIDRILERALDRQLGAPRAIDLLRRELLGPSAARGPPVPLPRGRPRELQIEPRVVEALAQAGDGRLVPLRDLREWEARLARAEGVRPLPATTLWRRLIHLEAVGLVRREVRPGGPGGTRSQLEILRPVTEWPLPAPMARTHRSDAGATGPGPAPAPSRTPAGWSAPSVVGAGAGPSRRAPPS